MLARPLPQSRDTYCIIAVHARARVAYICEKKERKKEEKEKKKKGGGGGEGGRGGEREREKSHALLALPIKWHAAHTKGRPDFCFHACMQW